MKPARFAYVRPETLDEAVSVLADNADEAKVLAGGQSLVPMLNFRLAAPELIVDLDRVVELQGIHRVDGAVRINAMTRQRTTEKCGVVRERCPIVTQALSWVGHLQIRNRGTVGGSMAHADPAAELPAVAVALDAEIEAVSTRGHRTMPATSFLQGPFMTDLAPDEVLTAVSFPEIPNTRTACLEVAPRHGDFALVGVVAILTNADAAGAVSGAALAAFGVDAVPVRLHAAEDVLVGAAVTNRLIDDAADAAFEQVVSPTEDAHATSAYRRDVLAQLVRRAVQATTAPADEP